MLRAAHILCILVAALHAGALYAATLQIGSASVPAGAAVRIPLELDPAGETLAVVVLRLDYDSAAATFLGAEAGPVANGKIIAAHVTGDSLTVVLYGGPAITAGGVLGYLTFDMQGNAGTAMNLTDTGSDASSEGAEEVPLEMIGGVITLTEDTGQHSADVDGDWQFSVEELPRVLEYFEAGALHCDAESEDGYAAGPGEQQCAPHDSDYAPRDWRISLSESLRLVQLFNADNGHYHRDAESEDGYAPGPFEAP